MEPSTSTRPHPAGYQGVASYSQCPPGKVGGSPRSRDPPSPANLLPPPRLHGSTAPGGDTPHSLSRRRGQGGPRAGRGGEQPQYPQLGQISQNTRHKNDNGWWTWSPALSRPLHHHMGWVSLCKMIISHTNACKHEA